MKIVCSRCNLSKVCKYKDEFIEAVRNIEHDIAPYEDLVDVNVLCKHVGWGDLQSGPFVPREVSNE